MTKLIVLRRFAEKERRLAATRARDEARDARNKAASQDGKTSPPIEQRPDLKERAESQDPEWISKKTGRRACRVKYSNRGAGSSANGGGSGAPTTPGRVTVASPILRRVLDAAPDDSEAQDAEDGGQPESATAPDASSGTQRRRGQRTSSEEGKKPRAPSSTYLQGFPHPEALSTWRSCRDSLDTLLRNCSYAAAIQRRRGARSLFSMCLKKVPHAWNEYQFGLPEASIEQTNRLLKNLQEGNEIDMYDELETMWSMSEGWKPLHEVVRAHAIMLMEFAIADRTLTHLCVVDLIIVYQQYSLFEEIESLIATTIDAYPSSIKPPAIESNMFSGDPWLGTKALSMVMPPRRRGMQYRQITRLLGHGTIDPDWLVTRGFTLLWDTAIGSVCQDDGDCDDAWRFLETALRAALALWDYELEAIVRGEEPATSSERDHSSKNADLGLPAALSDIDGPSGDPGTSAEQADTKLDDAVDRLVSSLMEGLAAIQVLGNAHCGNPYTPRFTRGGHKIASLIASITTAIQRKLIISGEAKATWDWADVTRAMVALHAALLAGLGGRGRLSDACVQSAFEAVAMLTWLFDMLVNGLLPAEVADATTQLTDALTDSLFRIAHCCSRATRNGAPEIVRALVDNLVELANDDRMVTYLERPERELLSHMISRAVSRPAAEDDEQHRSEWARDLQSRFRPMKMARRGAKTSKRGPGGHQDGEGALLNSWEEDLCRRLASTPSLSSRRRRDSLGSESSEEEDVSQRRDQLLESVRAQTRLESPPRLSNMLFGNTPAASTKKPATTMANFRLKSSQSPSASNGRKDEGRPELYLPAKRKKRSHEKSRGKKPIQDAAPPSALQAQDSESAPTAAPIYSWSPGSPMLDDTWAQNWSGNIIPSFPKANGVTIGSSWSSSAESGLTKTPPQMHRQAGWSRAFLVDQPMPTALAAPGMPPRPRPESSEEDQQQAQPTRVTTTATSSSWHHEVSKINFRPRVMSKRAKRESQKFLARQKQPLPLRLRMLPPQPGFPSAREVRGGGYDEQDDSEDELCR